MDVQPPPAKDAVPNPPVLDIIAPATANEVPDADETPLDTKAAPEKPDEDKKKAKVKEAKPRNPHVLAAIIATILIVLGLAALATFAYLKQTGSI